MESEAWSLLLVPLSPVGTLSALFPHLWVTFGMDIFHMGLKNTKLNNELVDLAWMLFYREHAGCIWYLVQTNLLFLPGWGGYSMWHSSVLFMAVSVKGVNSLGMITFHEHLLKGSMRMTDSGDRKDALGHSWLGLGTSRFCSVDHLTDSFGCYFKPCPSVSTFMRIKRCYFDLHLFIWFLFVETLGRRRESNFLPAPVACSLSSHSTRSGLAPQHLTLRKTFHLFPGELQGEQMTWPHPSLTSAFHNPPWHALLLELTYILPPPFVMPNPSRQVAPALFKERWIPHS